MPLRDRSPEPVPGPVVAVLAGGLARRLNGEKAGAELRGRPLISYPLAAARAAGLPAIVVAKRGNALPTLDVTVEPEPDDPRHPLCGVRAALDHVSAAESEQGAAHGRAAVL